MKTFITLACLCLMAVSGCKKSSENTPANQVGLQVVVTGLTAKTALNIKITDVTMGNIIVLDLVNQFGNTTYTTKTVNPGDHLEVSFSTNIPDDLAGDGDGLIKFFYRGDQEGAVGGILTGTTVVNIPVQ